MIIMFSHKSSSSLQLECVVQQSLTKILCCRRKSVGLYDTAQRCMQRTILIIRGCSTVCDNTYTESDFAKKHLQAAAI